MRRLLIAFVTAGFMAAAPAFAGFQLVLNNGRILNGIDMAKKADKYVLTLPDGRTLMVAANKVQEVRILGDDVVLEESGTATPAAAAEAPEAEGEDGSPDLADEAAEDEEDAGQILAGVDTAPRLTRGKPTTVGGGELPEREKSEPLALTGDGQAPLGPGEWRPQSDWPDKDPDWPRDDWVNKGPDGKWTPESDFATDPEANQFNPSTWVKPAKDPTWRPTDGFSKTNTALRSRSGVTPPGVAPGRTSGLQATRSVAATTNGSLPGSDGFTAQEGNAAWYGEPYRGRKTASGSRFDPDALSAAHASLPFGTLVVVTRLSGEGQSVVVEINDRGAGDRVINLSRAAAEALGIIKMGVASVRVEKLPAGDAVAAVALKPDSAAADGTQEAGASGVEAQAETQEDRKLDKEGQEPGEETP